MEKLDSMNVILIIITAFYLAKKIFMYIRYKKSGEIMLKVKLQRDFITKLIWIVIATVGVVPVAKLYLSGISLPTEEIKNTIVWVFFIIIVSYIETLAPKITEGGITASGDFWDWKNINSCKWSLGEKSILLIEAKSTFILFKYPTSLIWRVLPEQKLSINNLLKGKMK